MKHLDEMQQNGWKDLVTGLLDNRSFLKRIEAFSIQSEPCGIMMFSLDNFKQINDLYSYSFGDLVMKAFVDDIKSSEKPSYELYRLDGNSFGVLAIVQDIQEMVLEFERIQGLAQMTRNIEGLHVSLSISGGICQYPQDGTEAEILYRNARLALTQATVEPKRKYMIYQEHMSKEAVRDMILLEELKYSVEHNFEGFEMYYQPLMNNKDKSLFGCEALLRFHSTSFPQGVNPFIFIPILENSGLILDVGRWILDTSFAQCAVWRIIMPNFQMNVNASARQFDEESFVEDVLSALKKHHLSPEAITVELTESNPAQFDAVKKAFDYLRKQGLKTAFDDFGTGYASVEIFRSISGDELKIDRSFLERITYDVTDQVLLKSLIDMCKAMGILVCVEGIESTDIEHIVSLMSPDLLQGYLYSKPIPADVFEQRFIRQMDEIQNKQGKELPAMLYAPLRPAKPMTMAEIVNNAYAGIFQVGMDEEFTFLTCNEGYRRMLGYTTREMEEKFSNKALGFVHPDDTNWVNDEFRRQLGQGDTVSAEFRIVRKDGKSIWIFGTGNVVQSPDGNSSLIVNIVDIDKSKRENMKKLERLDLYEAIMNRVPSGIKYIHYDEGFTIDYISPGFLALLGYTQEEVCSLFDGKYINMILEEDRPRLMKDIQQQLNEGNTIVHLRYRSYCKDGPYIWLQTVSRLCDPDEDGIQRCCSCVVDITNDMEKEQPVTNISQRFQVASRQWGDVMFEYDYKSGHITFFDGFETMFAYQKEHVLTIEELMGHDSDLFYEALEIAKLQEQGDSIDVQMRKADGTKLWCRIQLGIAELIERSAISVLGKITNINEEYKEKARLEKEAQMDSLTKLSSKGAIEQKVNRLLAQGTDSQYALILLDVDNFKQFNDIYGHFAGDMVLKTLGLRIRNIFRGDDIIGRVGGDEFLIAMQYNGKSEVLQERCERLQQVIGSAIKLKEYDAFNISASVGIACYPETGKNFAQLYEQADKALYRVKMAGKNHYLIYEQ